MSRTDREYIERLKKLQKGGDIEAEHAEADDVLCELLRELSYNEVVDEWEKVEKWYA